MSTPAALAERRRLPLHRRLAPLGAVAVARVLARLPPVRLRKILELAHRGAPPTTFAQADAARQAVISVSLRCAGQACLQRSLAVALLCRIHGTWPTWRTGVRVSPFTAHAWVEAEGRPVGEPFPQGHYHPLLTVPPVSR